MSTTAEMSPAIRADAPPELEALGVHAGTLPDEIRERLDRQGFAIIPGVIDDAWLARLRERVDTHARAEGAGGMHENSGNLTGLGLLSDLVNKGEAFDGIWSHPLALAAAWHVLATPFRLYCLDYRDPLPGQGQQDYHPDTPPVGAGGPFLKLQCLWALDDVTPENGATRAIPGSHLGLESPLAPGADAMGDHPDQIHFSAPAGSLVLWNGNLWHGGTTNRNGARRRTLIQAFVPRDHPQKCDQAEYLRVRTAKRLGAAQRWVLDA